MPFIYNNGEEIRIQVVRDKDNPKYINNFRIIYTDEEKKVTDWKDVDFIEAGIHNVSIDENDIVESTYPSGDHYVTLKFLGKLETVYE